MTAKYPLVRFADDFVVLCRDETEAEKALNRSREILTEVGLCLNEDKTRVASFEEGFRFLGSEFVASRAPQSEARKRISEGDAKRKSAPPARGHWPSRVIGPAAFQQDCVLQKEGQVGGAGEPQNPARYSKPAVEVDDAETILESGPLFRSLYLMEQGCVLSKTGERFIVSKQRRTLREIPAIQVNLILVFGNVHVTTPAIRFCLARAIPVVLLSRSGRYLGSVEAAGPSHAHLQRDQFARAADALFCMELGRELVLAKIAGCRLMLRRYRRTREADATGSADRALGRLTLQAKMVQSLEQLRGCEGAAAAAYFRAMRALLDPVWGFARRQRRPPPDPVNAVLSYVYTLLFSNVHALVRATGLNPGVGFLHPMREGHAALVSDLMEEFRAVLADAVVWPLFLNDALRPQDFEFTEISCTPCRMDETTRTRLIHAFEAKVNSVIVNPHTGTRSDYRRLIAYQAQALAKAVRSESPYRAMVFK